jgi:hypothetical protein
LAVVTDRSTISTPGGDAAIVMTAAILIALDYSGTLSAGAVAFARGDRLRAALASSGLAAFGIDTPERYWQEVVDATWITASLMPRPFARFIAERVMQAAPADAGLTEGELLPAARRFVADYLRASAVSPAWLPLLDRLCRLDDARVIVATDHYSEATPAIIGHLTEAGFPSAPCGGPPAPIQVANSADLGYHKIRAEFWRKAADATAPDAASIIVVDDFGAAEAGVSSYAAKDAVARRRRLTSRALRAAGGWKIFIHPFAPDHFATHSAAVAAAERAVFEAVHDR